MRVCSASDTHVPALWDIERTASSCFGREWPKHNKSMIILDTTFWPLDATRLHEITNALITWLTNSSSTRNGVRPFPVTYSDLTYDSPGLNVNLAICEVALRVAKPQPRAASSLYESLCMSPRHFQSTNVLSRVVAWPGRTFVVMVRTAFLPLAPALTQVSRRHWPKA
jgi:hypothetical protein